MTKSKLILLLAGAAVTTAVVSRLLRQRVRPQPAQPPEVMVELNSCKASELLDLGLDQDSVERVLENR
ncbi:MAG: hypothetical protein H0X25_20375, partial [Acidobacteriales bacterium]|nr:hypothetical protein [Terriglobales bacterium]